MRYGNYANVFRLTLTLPTFIFFLYLFAGLGDTFMG